jgi:hypothetical protein
LVAGAQYVVGKNTRHLLPLLDGRHGYQGVEYMTDIEFIG